MSLVPLKARERAEARRLELSRQKVVAEIMRGIDLARLQANPPAIATWMAYPDNTSSRTS